MPSRIVESLVWGDCLTVLDMIFVIMRIRSDRKLHLHKSNREMIDPMAIISNVSSPLGMRALVQPKKKRFN